MRIAMVSEHASPLAALGGDDAGGQNVHVAALATELGARGLDVVVHTRRDDPSLPRRVKFAPGVVVHHVDAGPPEEIAMDQLFPYMDDLAAELAQQWEDEPPQLVHSHFWMSGRAALAAAEPLGIPVVHTFHALGVVKRRHQGAKDPSPPERLREERSIVRRADLILATCSDEVFELVRLGADMRRVRVVPCGVDLTLFTPDGPAEPRRDGLHRLVCVTRLRERKGVGNAIAALADLPETELVVAGGPKRARLRQHGEARRLLAIADEFGVADRVDFRGSLGREELPPLFRSADAALCVPWYEPFGIVALEAMACGVPVIASAIGGLIDSVVDGVTGVHVPPRAPERIAEAAADLLANPEERARLGAAGAVRVRRRYSWERVADATLEAYAGVVRLPLAAAAGTRR